MKDHRSFHQALRALIKGHAIGPDWLRALTPSERKTLRALAHLADAVRTKADEGEIYRNSLNQTLGFYEDMVSSLTAFRRIVEGIAEGETVESLCKKVVRIIAEELLLEYCSILLWDPERQRLVFQAGMGSGETKGNAGREIRFTTIRTFALGEGIAGKVAKSRQPILITDVDADDRFLKLPTLVKIGSMLCLPMMAGATLIGVINLSHPRKRFFNRNHEQVFTILSAIVAQIIGAHRLQSDLELLNRDLEDRVAVRTRESRAYQEYLERLLETAGDLIFTADGNGCFSFLNAQIQEYGYDTVLAHGRPLTDLFPELIWETCWPPAEGRRSCDLVLRTADGRLRDLHCALTTLRDEKGEPIGLLGIARDMTDQRRLEQRLRQTEKLASLGELVSGIAHELNNQLVPVLAYSELLQLSTLQDEDRKMVRMITEAALGARNVVSSLLGFARQQKPSREWINLHDALRQALAIFKHRLKVENIALHVETLSLEPPVLADFHQMKQVFLNILSNACQAMEGVGGTLAIRTWVADDCFLAGFTDTGPGIPPEVLDKIFDPFFTTKEVGKGTGLGLSLCYGIAREHQGNISVESEPGRTTFTVRIPLAAAEGSLREEFASVSPAAVPGKRILIVDDEEFQLDVMREVLGRDYAITTVQTAQEAMTRLDQGGYDLVITDIKMPSMGGMQLHQWIRQHVPSLAGKVLVTTGDTFSEKVREFLRDMGDCFVTKPYDVSTLRAAVARLLAC